MIEVDSGHDAVLTLRLRVGGGCKRKRRHAPNAIEMAGINEHIDIADPGRDHGRHAPASTQRAVPCMHMHEAFRAGDFGHLRPPCKECGASGEGRFKRQVMRLEGQRHRAVGHARRVSGTGRRCLVGVIAEADTVPPS